MKTSNHVLLQEPIGNHSQHVSYFIEETTIGLQMNLPKKNYLYLDLQDQVSQH